MAFTRNKSYVHTPSKEPFIGLTMHELLEERVKRHPDREMLVFVSDKIRLTFVEYFDKVIDLAAGLSVKLGLQRGDCVAVIGNNHVEWPLIAGAARAIGVIIVCLQIGNSKDTLKNIICKTSCKAMFILSNQKSLYSDVCKMIPVVITSKAGDLNSKENTFHFDDVFLSGHEKLVREMSKCVSIDDISHMCMTSGTTGMSKLVPVTHFQALNGIVLVSKDFGETSLHRIACVGNMAYTVGIQMSQIAPLVFGSTSVFPSPMYNFECFLKAIQNERCTYAMITVNIAVSLAYNTLVESYDLSSLQSGHSAGSPISPTILLHLKKKLGIPVMNAYGTTEVSSASSICLDDATDTYSTVGRPLKNVEIQIVENGIPVLKGETGEVWVRSPVIFNGYYNDVEETRKSKLESGWFKTGDIGKLDANGYLTIVGRTKDIIIRYSRNIIPSLTEKDIISHPSVMDVQVVGIPDYRMGEDVCACVRLNEGTTVTEEDILNFCVDKVAPLYMPSYVLIFDVFPLGFTGKVDRKKLQNIATSRLDIPEQPVDFKNEIELENKKQTFI